MKVQDIYTEVCDVLLESGGLTLGMVTEDDFLRFYGETYQDFLQKSGIVKKIANVHVETSVSIYEKPECVMDSEELLYDRRYLHGLSALDLDMLKSGWKTENGTPRRWHEDRLPVRRFQVQPTPPRDGYSVAVTAAFYGTLSAVGALPADFDIAVSAPFYGVISSFSGPIYLETMAWGLGTISGLVSDTLNATMIGTAKPIGVTWDLDSFVEWIPDSFAVYLKWGILQSIFSMDGETKDEQRAAYCGARWNEGIALSEVVSQAGLQQEEG